MTKIFFYLKCHPEYKVNWCSQYPCMGRYKAVMEIQEYVARSACTAHNVVMAKSEWYKMFTILGSMWAQFALI